MNFFAVTLMVIEKICELIGVKLARRWPKIVHHIVMLSLYGWCWQKKCPKIITSHGFSACMHLMQCNHKCWNSRDHYHLHDSQGKLTCLSIWISVLFFSNLKNPYESFPIGGTQATAIHIFDKECELHILVHFHFWNVGLFLRSNWKPNSNNVSSMECSCFHS